MENNHEPVVINSVPGTTEEAASEVEPVVINPAETQTLETAYEERGPEFTTFPPATRQESFAVGETQMTLSMDEDGKVSACINELCHDIGLGDELFNSLSDLFSQLWQPE